MNQPVRYFVDLTYICDTKMDENQTSNMIKNVISQIIGKHAIMNINGEACKAMLDKVELYTPDEIIIHEHRMPVPLKIASKETENLDK